jgi:heavy metal translocating P-type ATPase
MLTGESKPVSKQKGNEVFAGTLNLNGKIAVKITESLKNTRLSKIIEAVEEAQNKKAPIQNLADKIVGYFVPVVISISLGTFFYWYYSINNFTDAFLNAISVMVIACPCALGLATPLAVLIATGKIAKTGAIVKNGDTVEILSKVKSFCFDKTGTITKGKLEISEIITFGIKKEKLLSYAASAEIKSNHLISKAILKAYEKELYEVKDFKEIPGKGIKAKINNDIIVIGNKKLIEENEIILTNQQNNEYQKLMSKGYTIVIVAVNDKISGFIALSDVLRENSKEVLIKLLKLGIKSIVLTGDNLESAKIILKDFKDIEIFAEINPFEKQSIIKKLKYNNFVAMVGDGINDAPALIEADVGLAIGKGTDIAVESSDIVLLRDDLNIIPSILKISRSSLKIIKQNLFWAFSYNLVTIPLAVSGKIHPVFSAVLMSISSLFVVFNSLRIGK